MIKIEKEKTYGWEGAIRGMRNPLNSWSRMDSLFDINCDDIACKDCPEHGDCNPSRLDTYKTTIGPNDHELMMKLAKGGPAHAKYRRMIAVYVDITAPLYWWKEFDTYKVGTVANSCSTMHKIHAKEFTLDDFSCEHLNGEPADDYIIKSYKTFLTENAKEGQSTWAYDDERGYLAFNVPISENHSRHYYCAPKDILELVIGSLNANREAFLKTKDKKYWWQMIQLLPSSYNQKRTVMLNYEVLNNIYHSRKNHKLDEWRTFCEWIKGLPYSEIIIGEEKEAQND